MRKAYKTSLMNMCMCRMLFSQASDMAGCMADLSCTQR